MPTLIWWIRRDFRLSDNPALSIALDQAGAEGQVIPAFILDPFFDRSPYVGEKRVSFMLAGLRELDRSLRERGSYLVVRRGSPVETLSRLVEETGAQGILAQADYSPYARRRDAAVEAALPLTLTGGLSVYPPDAIYNKSGDPYVVFTYYMRRWRDLPPRHKGDRLPAPDHLPTPADLPTDPLPDTPTLPDTVPFPPGEAEAQRRLHAFTESPAAPVFRYDSRRDTLAAEATSRLSPYLRWGMLSPGQAAAYARDAVGRAATEEAQQEARRWLVELIWRDFYITILYHYPRVRGSNFYEKYDNLQWENDPAQFDAWCAGRTGFPVVDAAMRQLTESGWMHNRARMIVASFLTKDLLIDWQWGERFFMQHLLDGDVSANNGGWQWAAGTGTDAAPYFRIFNPTSQARKHDPAGEYIRRWLPELANVPDDYIHQPHTMPADVQKTVGCQIGTDYLAPIVDHSEARQRTLAAYKATGESRD